MAGFISKQPNGLYCRFSTVVDCPTDWNMTEEDYIEQCAEKARKEAKERLLRHIKPFNEIVDYTRPTNMSVSKMINMFKDMGYKPTMDEICEWEVYQKEYNEN